MTDKEKKFITVGDIVEVRWETIERLEGGITHIAFDEGMAMPEYTIKDDTGNLHQVMHYCRISLLSKQ